MSEYFTPEERSKRELGPDDYFVHQMNEYEKKLNILAEANQPLPDKNEIIRELDGLCPYLGKKVLFGGSGIFPGKNSSGEPIDKFDTKQGMVGISKGTNVFRVSRGEEIFWKVYHKILISRNSYQVPATHQVEERIYCYMETDSEIIPYDSLDDIFSSQETIIDAESLLGLRHISTEVGKILSTKEFQQSAEELQHEKVQVWLEGAEQFAALRNKEVLVNGSRFYVPLVKDGGLTQDRLDIDSNITVSGICLGYGSLGVGEQQRAIQDEDVGLCLALDLCESSRDFLAMDKRQLLLVPLSDAANEISIL